VLLEPRKAPAAGARGGVSLPTAPLDLLERLVAGMLDRQEHRRRPGALDGLGQPQGALPVARGHWEREPRAHHQGLYGHELARTAHEPLPATSRKPGSDGLNPRAPLKSVASAVRGRTALRAPLPVRATTCPRGASR